MKKLLVLMAFAPTLLFAKSLRIGLTSDPRQLDPMIANSAVSRVVFQSLFERLVDTNSKGEIIPGLATKWEWKNNGMSLVMDIEKGVTFHDGTKLDAEAIKFNLDRGRLTKGSLRAKELGSIKEVKVVGSHKIQIDFKEKNVSILAQFTDRAGTIVSPTAAKKYGDKLTNHPVGSGPYKFVKRELQNYIELEKYDGHKDAKEYSFEKVVFVPIPDHSVRNANLISGDLDLVERISTLDVISLRKNSNFRVYEANGFGFGGILFNTLTSKFKDKALRQALNISIDRDAITQVVFDGEFESGDQTYPPGHPYNFTDIPKPKRDVNKAKAILAKAGIQTPVSVDFSVPNDPVNLQIAQMIQAMAAESGIAINLKVMEFGTMVQQLNGLTFDMSMIGWSGRLDPDGNMATWYSSKGQQNYTSFKNVELDKILTEALTVEDYKTRYSLYNKAQYLINDELPRLNLYHQKWQWGANKNISGFKARADGLINLDNVKRI